MQSDSGNVGGQRAFAQKLTRIHNSDVRRQVKQGRSDSPAREVVKSISRVCLTPRSPFTDVVDPIDFEEAVQAYRKWLLTEKDLPLVNRLFADFPPDDLQISIVPREIRTLDPTLPPNVSFDQLSAHTKDCIQSYTADLVVVSRKYNSYGTGQSYRSHCSQRSALSQLLMRQTYEVDIDEEKSTRGDKLFYAGGESQRNSYASSDSTGQSNGTSDSGTTARNSWRSSMLDLQQSSGDPPLLGITGNVNPNDLNAENRDKRQVGRQENLFAIYPVQHEQEVLERRFSAPLPREHLGHRILIKLIQLKLEFEFEPIFGIMALYDAREKKKISENFYFEMNTESIKGMLRSHVPYQDVSTLARACIFGITYPSPDVYLVIKLEKVLQPGEISEAVESYLKEDKKAKTMAPEWCERLGAYRMPFAWTAVYLTNVFTGGNSLDVSQCGSNFDGGINSDSESLISAGTLERRSAKASTASLRGANTPTPNELMRTGSVAAFRSSIYGQPATEDLSFGMENFKPVTLTINNLFKQESDRLSDEDLFKVLLDVKKPATLSKKLKCVPGIIKIDISPCPLEVANCLSPELLRLNPYLPMDVRPVKEVAEFPSKEVYSPNFAYRDLLFVYPKGLNFSAKPGSARNIAVKVQLMKGEDRKTGALPVLFGKSGCPELSDQVYTIVNYHNKTPVFYDEVKIKLPPDISDQHHLFFTFYHVSCKPKSTGDQSAVETPIGYTWLPIFKNGSLQTGDFSLPVALETLPASYSYLSPDVNLPNMKWLDGHKKLFNLTVAAISTVHTQDPYLDSFVDFYHWVRNGRLPPRVTEGNVEAELRRSVMDLTKARPEPLVKFLYILLDKLIDLLVNPPVINDQMINVGQTCFEMIGQIVKILSLLLENFCDHHGRSSLLTTYIQYACRLPHSEKGADDGHIHSGIPRSVSDPDGHLPHLASSPLHRDMSEVLQNFERATSMRAPHNAVGQSAKRKSVHEEIALHWVVSSGTSREMATTNSWFFLELLVKSMGEYLALTHRLHLPRRLRFSEQFVDDITTLVNSLISEVISRYGKDFRLAQSLNLSLAFFIADLLSLMDRTYVMGLIRSYCKSVVAKMATMPDSVNLMLLKLEFIRVVTSHEHYITLNLPMYQTLNTNCDSPMVPGSVAVFPTLTLPPPPASAFPPSPTPSVSSRSSGGSLGAANSDRSGSSAGASVGAAELSVDYRVRHFLVGLVLADLATALETPHRALHHKAINILRNLLTCHDLDTRFNTEPPVKPLIASLYMPIMGIVLDSCSQLFDPYSRHHKSSDRNSTHIEDKRGDVEFAPQRHETSGFNAEIAMAIAGGTPGNFEKMLGSSGGHHHQGGGENLESASPSLHSKKFHLSLESTRNLLCCFTWMLKNLNQQQLSKWIAELSQLRLTQLLDVLQLCVSNFEYRGKGVQAAKTTTIEDGRVNSGRSDYLKSKLEEALIGGQNVRTAFINSRRVTVEETPSAAMTASVSSAVSTPVGIRWRKDQIQYRQTLEHYERVRPEVENDSATEGNLSAEVNMIVLDTLELIVTTLTQNPTGPPAGILNLVVRVILHMMACNQSVLVLQSLFASQRALVLNYPWLLLEEETEQCADLCMHLLRHCSSSLSAIRSQAAASLYLLMRRSFETGSNFARIKMQVTVSLSSLVGTGVCVNESCLRRSLKTILTYAEEDMRIEGDPQLSDTSFCEQVKDLVFNLHMILSDTVKMKEFQHDFEMLIDLMYRIAKGYQNSPDLRLTWLQSMAQKHVERQNFAEAAQCIVHAAALVAEYLQMLEDLPHRPAGCVTFLRLSENVLEESAVSDDVVSPDEEGICESRYFSESGLSQLLEQSSMYFGLAQMYESMQEVQKLFVPILEFHRDYHKIATIYGTLAEVLAKIEPANQYGRRVFGTFFRVRFYGTKFGDLNDQEFVYKEPSITKLSEISHRLENFFAERFGNDMVEVIKDSNNVDRSKLNPDRGYLQVTYVEPFFDHYELRHRPTYFEQHNQIRRFMYATPFTLDGKAHGDLVDQYKRKTILTTSHSFPYVKTRIQVVAREQIVLTPIEVAIEDLQKKTKELAMATGQHPPDAKMLQMVLQGCIGTTVNQGPMEVANVFLSGAINNPNGQPLDKLQNKLRLCFKDFSKKCADALRENKRLIGPDQKEYQRELERNYVRFTERLAPMVAAAPLSTGTLKRHHRRHQDSVGTENDESNC